MLISAKKATKVGQLSYFTKASMSFTHNFHHPTTYFVNGVKHTTDYNTDVYSPQVRAFLKKRWTAKREIPPKISVMRDMGPSYQQVYHQQRLPFSEYMYDVKHLERLYDAESVNT